MGRKKGLLSTLIKISNDAERSQNRRQKKEQTRIKQILKDNARLQKIQERAMKQLSREEEKNVAQHKKEIRSNLTLQTIEVYSLGRINEIKISIEEIPGIDLSLNIIKKNEGDAYFQNQKKIESSAVDDFLYCNKYNSVLGLDGFKIFKDNLKTLIDGANKGTSKDNLINLDNFFEVLLKSGIYYEANYLPDNLKQDYGVNWLTAYRFVSKNLPSITYKEYRQLVKCLERTDGNTLEFDTSEISSEIYKKIVSSGLFVESSSAENILATLSMSQLRDFCFELHISSKRSKEETIKHLLLIESSESIIKQKYPNKGDGLVFKIKDTDLVKGVDIMNLDKYLRNISKQIRTDLSQFIESKRTNKFL